jgi:hypothetical protein
MRKYPHQGARERIVGFLFCVGAILATVVYFYMAANSPVIYP